MSDTTNCPRTECSCPCLPKVTLDQAVIDLVESIALQENALSHILCAESRKMNAAMELDGQAAGGERLRYQHGARRGKP